MAKTYGTIIFLFIFIFLPWTAFAANLYISPASGTYEVGSKVVAKVIVTSDTPINAVYGLISYPASIFSVESVSKTNSILDFWINDPIISKTAGTIKFQGVALHGFSAASGTVVTMNLRAIKKGSGTFSFQSGKVLANDGDGTNITGNLIGATFTVKDKIIKPLPTPIPIPIPIPTPAPEPLPPPIIEMIPEVLHPEPILILKAPEIMLGSQYGTPSIVGTSGYVKAETRISFVAPDGAKVFVTGVSDTEGAFSVVIPNSLKHDLYTVTAVMIKDEKMESEMSNSITIKIGNIISDIDTEVILFIFFLILFILFLLLYLSLRSKGKSNINNFSA